MKKCAAGEGALVSRCTQCGKKCKSGCDDRLRDWRHMANGEPFEVFDLELSVLWADVVNTG